jgi:hypothetical protein
VALIRNNESVLAFWDLFDPLYGSSVNSDATQLIRSAEGLVYQDLNVGQPQRPANLFHHSQRRARLARTCRHDNHCVLANLKAAHRLVDTLLLVWA